MKNENLLLIHRAIFRPATMAIVSSFAIETFPYPEHIKIIIIILEKWNGEKNACPFNIHTTNRHRHIRAQNSFSFSVVAVDAVDGVAFWLCARCHT